MKSLPYSHATSKTGRRLLVPAGAALLASVLAVTTVSWSAPADPATTSQGETSQQPDVEVVEVTEGTNIAVTASPDGESIIMELQGFLFPAAW